MYFAGVHMNFRVLQRVSGLREIHDVFSENQVSQSSRFHGHHGALPSVMSHSSVVPWGVRLSQTSRIVSRGVAFRHARRIVVFRGELGFMMQVFDYRTTESSRSYHDGFPGFPGIAVISVSRPSQFEGFSGCYRSYLGFAVITLFWVSQSFQFYRSSRYW